MSRELPGCSFESDQVKDMYRILVTLLVEYVPSQQPILVIVFPSSGTRAKPHLQLVYWLVEEPNIPLTELYYRGDKDNSMEYSLSHLDL